MVKKKFDDKMCHEGGLSRMPGFSVFSLLGFRERAARSHGIGRNGDCKRKSRVQKLVNCTLRDLATKLDVHGRHCMLSYLSSLPVSVLRGLDAGANGFCGRTGGLCGAALLAGCYTQRALRPVIDSKVDHIRHFIKVPFVNRGMDFVGLPSIFGDGSVRSSMPNYFGSCGMPVVCCGCNKPIRGAVFNFNGLVSDLDIEACTPGSWACRDSKYVCPAAGHVVAGSLGVVSDSGVRSMVAKGPKYRFPVQIDFLKCRKNCRISC